MTNCYRHRDFLPTCRNKVDDEVDGEEMLGVFLVDTHNVVVFTYVDQAMKEHLRDANVLLCTDYCSSPDSSFASSTTSGFVSDDSHPASNATLSRRRKKSVSANSWCDISYRLLPLIMLYKAKAECDTDPIQSIVTSNQLCIKFRQLPADYLIILIQKDSQHSWKSEHLLDEFVNILNMCYGAMIFDVYKSHSGVQFPPEIDQKSQLHLCYSLLHNVKQSIAPHRMVPNEACSTLPGCVEMNVVFAMGNDDYSNNVQCNSYLESLQVYFDSVVLCAIVEDYKFVCVSKNNMFGRRRYKTCWLSQLQKLHGLRCKLTPCGYIKSRCIYHFQIWLEGHSNTSTAACLFDYFIIELVDDHQYLTFLCEAQFVDHLHSCADVLAKLSQNIDDLQPSSNFKSILHSLSATASTNNELINLINRFHGLCSTEMCRNSQTYSILCEIVSTLQCISFLTARTYRTELIAKVWTLRNLVEQPPLAIHHSNPTPAVTVQLGLDIAAYLIVHPEKKVQISHSSTAGVSTEILRLGLEYCNLDLSEDGSLHPRFMQLSVDNLDHLFVLISVGDWNKKINIFKKSKWVIKRLHEIDTSCSDPIWVLTAFEPFINHSLAVRQTKQLLQYFLHKLNQL